MNKPVLILGAGGHAKVLIEALLQSGATLAGITDPDPDLAGKKLLEVPVLGGDEVVGDFPQTEILLVNGLGSIGVPTARKGLFERFRAMGYRFATVIHPSAIIASDVELGEGVQVMAGAVIQPGCRVGCNTIINTRASVDHDCRIGNNVHIGPGATLSGGVSIDDDTHIGTGATIIQGIEIGSQSVVAAGSVVVKNVDNRTAVMGVPARGREK